MSVQRRPIRELGGHGPSLAKIVIGTRGSELARSQTHLVVERLQKGWPDLKIEINVIRTRGDDHKSGPVDIRGGRKGLFTGEIEHALVAQDVDLAVHSAKDLPSRLTPGTEIAAVLPRAPVDDVLIARTPGDLYSLPAEGIVATGSVRRRHQLRWKRPDLAIVDLRGNVPTRLRKLAESEWHAIILARAGLDRLGLARRDRWIAFEGNEFSAELLPPETFVPAGGQGVIAIQIRSEDDRLKMLLEPISDVDTRLCLRAEREFLRLLGADCNQPVGVLATIDGKRLKMRAQIFDSEVTRPREAVLEGPREGAERLAARLLEQINGEQEQK
jgi:hydroxymethylbilane synthase